jgi:hypothetical protein
MHYGKTRWAGGWSPEERIVNDPLVASYNLSIQRLPDHDIIFQPRQRRQPHLLGTGSTGDRDGGLRQQRQTGRIHSRSGLVITAADAGGGND